MVESRREYRRHKKKRKRKIFLSSLLLFLLLGIGWTSYEYMAGKRDAMGESSGELENVSKYADEFKGVDNEDGKTTVLLMGVDSREEGDVARTDTIMVAQYDPEKNSAKLVSLMRDMYVDIPGHGKNKLNAAFAIGGPELLRQTIKENFGINSEYYAIVDFEGFKQIVDTIAPDGVTIDVEKDMYYKDNAGTIDLEEGTQTLNGDELLGYARFRHDAESDFGRVRRQQQVMKALKEELVSASGLLKIPRLIGTLQPFIDTNIGSGKMLDLAKDFLLNPPENVETLRLPVEGSFWNDSVPGVGAILAYDEEENRQAIQDFLGK
ncbi:LCP family protein [Thalassobacillus pellis]|uniref:LCP family protein n=1 Tax=Thalassobacillus pellis TaxID=748008 RepID=UPI00195F505F|nr:LCP family protein [Thalassobacillus pellis]MBM7554039.1 LCP family protein required for cell wall assembly [Thalassobacillus pellis]